MARLVFCQRHRNDGWALTLFTDESRFATSPDHPVMWWVKRGDHIFMEKDKFPFSIMVWAGIVGNRKTQLLVCPQRLDAEGYVQLLEGNGIVDFLRQIGDGAIFQQDGAPCHRAARARRWFERNNVTVLEGWPANSPDLSPIEQIWAITKKLIIDRYGMTTPLANDQLEPAVFEAYDRIEPRTIAILTMSVKYRVQLCLARQGGFVGDALDECCHRERVEFEASTTLQPVSIIPTAMIMTGTAGGEGTDDGEGVILARLPSFRDRQ